MLANIYQMQIYALIFVTKKLFFVQKYFGCMGLFTMFVE